MLVFIEEHAVLEMTGIKKLFKVYYFNMLTHL